MSSSWNHLANVQCIRRHTVWDARKGTWKTRNRADARRKGDQTISDRLGRPISSRTEKRWIVPFLNRPQKAERRNRRRVVHIIAQKVYWLLGARRCILRYWREQQLLANWGWRNWPRQESLYFQQRTITTTRTSLSIRNAHGTFQPGMNFTLSSVK